MSYQLKCCVGILLALLLIPAAYSQEVRASLTGQVSDPSGAPIAGATVTVVNAATNFTVTAKSNESGQYSTPYLQPGTYEMSVENTGFKKYLRKDIGLQAGDKTRVDVKLEVGELTQSVTVTEATSQLQTETANRSQVLASEIVANLPTQGRNPFQIAWAAAGVVKSGTWRYLRSADIGGTSGISINGGREKTNEVLLDGISNVRGEYTVISIPTTESVQEFKVQSNTYDAQYGRTGGGVITIVTKGGGNDFHGTLFEYFQNDKLNANQSELNAPLTAGGVYFPLGRKPPNHINQFGAQVSGPIVIPKLFNGKNRVFWMLSWESLRQRSADPDVKTFPIMDIRGGDFTNLLNGAGQQVLIYDPYTTQPDGSHTPFANNKIPAARLDPVALKLLSYYPKPSSEGTGFAHVNNYPYPSMWRASFDQFVGRTDVVINSKNTAFFRYNESPFQEYRAVVFGLDNKAEPTGNAPLLRSGRNVMMNWTSTLSPTMTFDFRFGLNRWEELGGSSIGANFDPTQLGFSSGLVNQYLAKRFPQISLQDYQAMGSDAIGPGTRDTYSMQPNFSKVTGRHFMKFGAEARQYNLNDPGRGYP
ncbi:MAG: carboxypeptidase-like regulatory domain-containing protein, partial [Acidobacteria bacterium]|nr:carboxypeptidase-like regulatory domain-containing protein [Acidobacteriota bacterium]